MVAAFTEIKGSTWATTDTLEAIRDRGDAAWVSATGFSTHSAADVVTALGTGATLTALATATNLATLDTLIDRLDRELPLGLGEEPRGRVLEAGRRVVADVRAVIEELIAGDTESEEHGETEGSE
jgi:hypothetical protein